jgi:CBS domain containing-hemolysin-like protein
LAQAPLTEILEKIVSHRIHRVYVVDEMERPVGLVTCTDVLRLIMKLAAPQQQQQQEADTGPSEADQRI